MHCKACDKRMDTTELSRKKPDGEPEDLCSFCLQKAMIAAGLWREPLEREITFTDAGINQEDL